MNTFLYYLQPLYQSGFSGEAEYVYTIYMQTYMYYMHNIF